MIFQESFFSGFFRGGGSPSVSSGVVQPTRPVNILHIRLVQKEVSLIWGSRWGLFVFPSPSRPPIKKRRTWLTFWCASRVCTVCVWEGVILFYYFFAPLRSCVWARKSIDPKWKKKGQKNENPCNWRRFWLIIQRMKRSLSEIRYYLVVIPFHGDDDDNSLAELAAAWTINLLSPF